ncbi:hypothetical protein Vqi01_20180 [Micromonospora qiuiae]|uniref:EF-hand domain-containing protein n=1 Tax=Micromonospora qiuiae TaxID=502268 RepID=A0ABQ4JA05_9ACTN|nr:hypothetical protein Vqi01_20180 [Micromonospora qiuiae]
MVPREPAGPGHRLLDLQRTAGNAAVQRAIENARYGTDDPERIKAAKEFFALVDGRTQAAFRYVLTTPSLGAFVALDGHTALWSKLWNGYLATGDTQGLAAAFGYVIETLVSNPSSAYYAKAPDGYAILPQVTKGGTRPDLVLAKDGQQIAWVDLTASNREGHIFDKDSWDRHIAIYAEVTYDSLKAEHRATMVANKDNTGTISAEELEARLAAARKRYEKLRVYWKAVGTGLRFSGWKAQVRDSEGLKTYDMLDLQSERKIPYILELLRNQFGIADLDHDTAANILVALQVDPTRWGLLGSSSVGAGEAWLMANDEKSKEVS